MVSYNELLFWSLLLLCFGQSVGQPPVPRVTNTAPAYHQGITYNFSCIPTATIDMTTVYEVTFRLNGNVAVTSAQQFWMLHLNSTLDGSNVACSYRVTTSTSESPISVDFPIDYSPLPPPTLSPVDPSQHVSDGQPYNITCDAPSYLLPHIHGYKFINGSFIYNEFSPIKTVVPSFTELLNFTCSYEVAMMTGPSSDALTIMPSAITGVVVNQSLSQVYLGQSVTLTCNVTVDPNLAVPTGGFIFTVRWLNGSDDIVQNGTSTTFTTVLTSNITYRCEAAIDNNDFTSSSAITVPALEYPPPNVEGPSVTNIYSENSYTFTCNSTLEGLVEFTEYRWSIDMTPTYTSPTNLLDMIIPYHRAFIRCVTVAGIYESSPSPPFIADLSILPEPYVNVINPGATLYFSGSTYTFSCISPNSDITSYSFIFKNNPTLSTTQAEQSINVTLDVNNPTNISCITYVFNSSSPESNPVSIDVTEISKPTIQSADMFYFSGNTYTFHCQAPPVTGANFTDFVFRLNGTSTMMRETSWISIEMPEPPYALSITCQSLINSHKSEESDPLQVMVSVNSQPTINIAPVHGIFIDGTAYNFTCVSTFSNMTTEYSFLFADDNSRNRHQANPTMVLVANVSQAHNISCLSSISNSSSIPSQAVNVVAVVPFPPTINVVDEPSHYLVGTIYTLQCQSHLGAFVTTYCLKNFTSDVACHSSEQFNFTAEEAEQQLSCNTFFGAEPTNQSHSVSVIGSGIVSTTANANNMAPYRRLRPYPGTNVTLTCNAILTSGYTESDVTFTWKEVGSSVFAHTMVTSVFVTNNMEKLYECEGTTGLVAVTSNFLNITAKDLPAPGIEVQNRPTNDSYEPGHRYSLVCDSELESLLTSYNWYIDAQLIDGVHTKQYLVQAMSYTHSYYCSIVIVSEESLGSPLLTIATESIRSVQVESNGRPTTILTPVFDSTLTLRCMADIKATATESPIYNWLEDGDQKDTGQELTIVAYAGYDHPVVCKVTVGDQEMVSSEVMITSREDPPTPQISLSTTQILPLASYTLGCNSDSLSLNTTITWYKDQAQIHCLHDQTLHITRYDPSIHDGEYTCEISVFGMAAVSDPTTMMGIAPGKPCQGTAQCTDPEYTGECQDERCVCSDDYRARLQACVLA